jgi:plastocyanin
MHMRTRRAVLSGLGVIAMLGSVVTFAPSAAAAPATYEVSVGMFLDVAAPAESMRFFPSTIDVHQGDVVSFSIDSFHTATLLPVGEGPVEWFDANASGTEPYALLQRDTDDGPRSYVFSTAVAVPTDPSCGGAEQAACSFDGSDVLNSGVPFTGPLDLSVSVDVAPGNTFYVVCLIHGAPMHMTVNVVPNGDPASDPDALDASNQAALTQDGDTALALQARFSDRRTSHEAVGGGRVWDAWAGVESRYVALFGMYPKKLKIAKGDTVQWHFDELTYELHTATFPYDVAGKIAKNSFVPVCDTGAGEDGPPELEAPPFCNDPTQLELALDDRFVAPRGDGTYSGPDYQSSGVRGGLSPIGDANYDLTFTEPSGDTPFQYICLIHPFMRGRVVVR